MHTSSERFRDFAPDTGTAHLDPERFLSGSGCNHCRFSGLREPDLASRSMRLFSMLSGGGTTGRSPRRISGDFHEQGATLRRDDVHRMQAM
jgi:hypothetical protein